MAVRKHAFAYANSDELDQEKVVHREGLKFAGISRAPRKPTGFGRLRTLPRKTKMFLAAYSGLVALSILTLILIFVMQNSGDKLTQKPASLIVIAPSTNVSKGTKLTEVVMREIIWPGTQLPNGVILPDENLRGFYAKVDLPANQPILKEQLSEVSIGNIISDQIPAGYRATTLQVDASAGVEGWATSGAHVDVVLTHQDQVDLKKKAQVIVQDAVVLSYNGQVKSDMQVAPRENLISSSSTVTLAAPLKDILKIQTAQALGRISLILRNNEDIKSGQNVVVSSDEFGAPRPPAPAPRPAPVFSKQSTPVSKPVEKIVGFARFRDDTGLSRDLILKPEGWEERADQD